MHRRNWPWLTSLILILPALGLAGTGLTKLAGFLEQRRRDRDSSGDKNRA